MPKGCMLSHDNLVWEATSVMEELVKRDPVFPFHTHRVVSFLPLSHVAGLTTDVIA